MNRLTFKKWLFINLIMALLLAVIITASLNIGPEHASILGAIKNLADTESIIVFKARLPRTILGALVGAALACGGTAFQSLLRNPLADPYILGVSGGAALGSVLGIAFHLPFTLVSLSAFVFAFLTMLLIYWIAETKGRLPAHTLLLTGVIFNAFAFALIMLVHSLVTMEQAHEILFFLMGSLEIESYSTIAVVGAFVVAGILLLTLFSNKMNLLSCGDETATALGVDIEKTRRRIFFGASLMIGAVVSTSGLIGFVGIFIPHTIRMIFGPDHRLLIPASALGGASFLIISDTFARTVVASGPYQTQLPVGVITALVGGPFFVCLLKKQMLRG